VDVKNKENSRLRASYWFWAEEKLETTRVFGDTASRRKLYKLQSILFNY
jgi:hypothetical protein